MRPFLGDFVKKITNWAAPGLTAPIRQRLRFAGLRCGNAFGDVAAASRTVRTGPLVQHDGC